MTLSSTVRRWDYVGSDSTDTFAYTTRVRDQTHLKVTEIDSGGVETVLVLTTNYTVTGIGNDTGGNVVRVAGNLATGFNWVIEIVEPLTQTTDIRNQGSFFPETHEDEFDHGVRLSQQQQDEIDRSTKNPTSVTSTEFNPVWPTGIDGAISKAPITNAAGNGWAAESLWPSAGDISGAEAAADRAELAAAASAVSAGTLSPYGINNLGLATSVAASAMTVAMKEADGTSDPSIGTDSVTIYFRNATAATGDMTGVSVSAALSVVIPSGATLGHNDALLDYIYVYAINNAGTVELAVSSSNHWDEGSTLNTTAISGAADDAATMYSTAARTGVAIRLIGRLHSNQTTAGTYAANASQVDVGFLFKPDGNIFTRAANFEAKNGIDYLISTAAARSVQLPDPKTGFKFSGKDSTNQAATNNITFLPFSGENINGFTGNFVYDISGGSFTVYSDGTNYFVIDHGSRQATKIDELKNVGLETTVAASALTIALKQSDGSTDANASSFCNIAFRDATLTSGAIILRQVTAALSLVVPSGATLGTANGVEATLFVYLIDNAGTVELAVSNTEFNTEGVISTTLIDATSDDDIVLYSATARTNVPIRLIGKLLVTEATAGTWATAPSTVTIGSKFKEVWSITEFEKTGGSNPTFTTSFQFMPPDGSQTVTVYGPGPGVKFTSPNYIFAIVGFYRFKFITGKVDNDTSSNDIRSRLRNTTDSTTVKNFIGNSSADAPTNHAWGNCVLEGIFQITDTSKNYELQFLAGAGTTTFNPAAASSTYIFTFEYLGI